jgi:hypothetical protein
MQKMWGIAGMTNELSCNMCGKELNTTEKEHSSWLHEMCLDCKDDEQRMDNEIRFMRQ